MADEILVRDVLLWADMLGRNAGGGSRSTCEWLLDRSMIVPVMATDPPKKPFSKRHGDRSHPKRFTVWEDAPEKRRHSVLELVSTVGYGPFDVHNLICSAFHRRPDPSNLTEYPNV
jgi:hypothetical protein